MYYYMMCLILMVLLCIMAIAVVICACVAMAFSIKSIKLTVELTKKEQEIRELENEVSILRKEN